MKFNHTNHLSPPEIALNSLIPVSHSRRNSEQRQVGELDNILSSSIRRPPWLDTSSIQPTVTLIFPTQHSKLQWICMKTSEASTIGKDPTMQQSNSAKYVIFSIAPARIKLLLLRFSLIFVTAAKHIRTRRICNTFP